MLRGRVDVNESLAEVGSDLHFGTTKNHRNRTVIIPAFLREMLNEHMVTFCGSDPDGLVFTASNGAAMRNSNFTKNVWQPAITEADLPERLRIHDLRHTAAALLISQGAHPEAIKRHLGHSSIVVTMDVYGHLFPSEAESLAEALDSLYAQTMKKRRGEVEREAEEMLDRFKVRRPSVDVERIARRLGYHVAFERFEGDLSGTVVSDPTGTITIGINSFHSPVRQRFSIAHEIGHAHHVGQSI